MAVKFVYSFIKKKIGTRSIIDRKETCNYKVYTGYIYILYIYIALFTAYIVFIMYYFLVGHGCNRIG